MTSFERDGCAIVVGASGGIGGALVGALSASGTFTSVIALSRRRAVWPHDEGVVSGLIDIADEESIAAAARFAGESGPARLVLVASGVLHDSTGQQPEKSYRALDADAMLHAFRINTVGPALVAKHFLPLLARRGRSVFAALSARVGSIGDNRLGGWYSYRASKAALNMIVRTLAIELARQNPDALCVGLHPGTVDTALSRPFQGAVPAGTLFSPGFAAQRLLAVVDALAPESTGGVFAWDGERVAA